MKGSTILFIFSLCLCAQLLPSGVAAGGEFDRTYQVTERGPHHRLWTSVTQEPDAMNLLAPRTNTYIELATGLHYRQGNEWVESQEIIEAYPTGAIARHGGHKVIFSENLDSAVAVDLQTPDGHRLQSRVLGLAYFDSASGQSVMLAEVKSSTGEIQGDNQVIYPDAFSDVSASVRYTYMKASFEQDVILLNRPAAIPEDFGLSSATTWLQLLTEFVTAPVPEVRLTSTPGAAVEDQVLSFGLMQMPQGKAFVLGSEPADDTAVIVTKRLVILDGRNILIEEVPLARIANQLQALPPAKRTASFWKKPARRIASHDLKLPERKPVKRDPREMLLARSERSLRGFVLDYTLLTSQSDFTFAANTNYYVTGTVNLSDATTIEGGTIVKFTNSTSAKINILGTVDCQTGPYRPAIFTAKDDNTVGETISGSTGSPSGTKYGNGLSVSTSGSALSYLRFSHANSAIRTAFSSGQLDLAHLQMVETLYAVDFDGNYEITVNLDNSLFYAITNLCKSGDDNILRGRHVTVNQCHKLFYLYGSGSGEFYLTNSILATVGYLGNADVFDGSHNGFYSSSTFGSVAYSGGNPFPATPVGAARHYLADDNYRNRGTTEIPSSRLDELKLRTTIEPAEITADITTDQVLSPAVLRDQDCEPDLGYHYDAIDHVARGRTVSANVTLSGGVVLATYGSSSTYGLGLDSGDFMSEGTPTRENWIVRYNTVQEQSTTGLAASSVAPCVKKLSSSATVNVRFTRWSLLGGTGDHFRDNTDATTPSAFSHSRFGGGNLMVDPGAVALTNCLLERLYVKLQDNFDEGREWYLYNNLFYGGTLFYRSMGDDPVMQAHDNLFDRVSIVKGISSELFTHGHNGYVDTTHLDGSSAGGDMDVTAPPDYQSDPLGRFYYPTTGSELHDLIGAGSRSATAAGLAEFTTQLNQAADGGTVDIGFHYNRFVDGVMLDWVFTDDGFILGGQEGALRKYGDLSSVADSPWSYPSSDNRTLRMDFENDNNCEHPPPFNEHSQTATAEALISVLEPVVLTIDWTGLGERRHDFMDRMVIHSDCVFVASARSPGVDLGCAPMASVISSTTPPVTINLEPGMHILRVKCETGDEFFHVGAYYLFELGFELQ